MQNILQSNSCLYQSEVVDFLTKSNNEHFMIENTSGNHTLSQDILKTFHKLTEDSVVWVKKDAYWRHRVPEDEPNREARG